MLLVNYRTRIFISREGCVSLGAAAVSSMFVTCLLPVFGLFIPVIWGLQPTALSAYYYVKIPFEKVHSCQIQPACLFYQRGFFAATELTYSIFHALTLLP